MFDLRIFALYLAALAAVYIAPGPDMALLVTTAAARGARAGLRTALGLACARSIHALASALGLAALFAAHPALQTGVRLAGAAYLLHLAVSALRGGKAKTESGGVRSGDIPEGSRGADFARGFLTNLLNPKALLFCGLFLPQFVAPGQGPALPQFLRLGAVLVLVGFVFDTIYALAAGGLPRLLGRAAGPRLNAARRWLMGSVFAALAARLAVG